MSYYKFATQHSHAIKMVSYIKQVSHALAGVYTFSTAVEGNVGAQIIKNDTAKNGLTRALSKEDLHTIQSKLGGDIIQLNQVEYADDFTGAKEQDAWVLHVPQGIEKLAKLSGVEIEDNIDELLFQEMNSVTHDSTYLNTRKNKVEQKRARHNFNVADHSQDPCIEKGINTLHNFKDMPHLNSVRNGISALAKELDIPTIDQLYAEANVYMDKTCGIRYHGDNERKDSPVIGVNMGEPRIIMWRSFYKHRFHGEEIRIDLQPGDVYIMSEHALGIGWQRNTHKEVIFRHRAGSPFFIARHDNELIRRDKKKDIVAANREEKKKKRMEKALKEKRAAEETKSEMERKRKANHIRVDKLQEVLSKAAREGPSDYYFYEWLKLSDNPRHTQLAMVWSVPRLMMAAMDAERGKDVDYEIISQYPDIKEYGKTYWEIMRRDFETRVESEHQSKKPRIVQDELVTGESVSIDTGDDDFEL